MNKTKTLIASALTSLLATSSIAAEVVESRGDWLRNSWGINWKPVDVYNGKSESLEIDIFLDQISHLKTIDYIQSHLGESSIKSSVHIAPHELLESFWQGDTDATGNPVNLVVPRASANVDPFLKILKKVKAAGMKNQVYVNSSNMLQRNESTPNPDYIPNITERWKAWVDGSAEAQAFIASQPYHTGTWDADTQSYVDATATYPERKYMFAYAEFVLKVYSERYGDLIDGWLFDSGSFMYSNGDSATNGVKEDQSLYGAFAKAAQAGNPNAPVSFNNSPERDTEELNPFSEATHYDDYMFGHPYNGGRVIGNHENGLYERNYAHIQKITATNGNVHSGSVAAGTDAHDWDWDDKVIGHFDPPMSTTSWNGGNTPALTDDEFNLWNLESAKGGGAISWGLALVGKSSNDNAKLVATDWALAQLTGMDAHLAQLQEPGAPNWARAHTMLTDGVYLQAYSHALVEGKDFWDPEGDAVTLALLPEGAPAWLQLVQDEANPGTWLLQGTTTESVETDYEFVIQATDASGTTERTFNLYVGAYVEPEVPEEPEEPAAPLLAQIFAAPNTNYGDDVIATMSSEIQTAPNGVATFQIALDVTPMAGGSVQSGSSSSSTTAASWGIGADDIFKGSDGEYVQAINNLRITNFNANGSCLTAQNISNLSFNYLEIANGQSSNDRVLVTSNGTENAAGGVKMPDNPSQYDVTYGSAGAISNLVLAVGNEHTANKWSVNNIAVTYSVQTPAVVAGDLDCDGVLGSADLQLIRAALGSSVGDDNYIKAADLDNDGVISRIDYSLWYRLFRG
nr:GH107 fucanase [uncultured bacterium]